MESAFFHQESFKPLWFCRTTSAKDSTCFSCLNMKSSTITNSWFNCLLNSLQFSFPAMRANVPMAVAPAIPALTRSGMRIGAAHFSCCSLGSMVKCAPPSFPLYKYTRSTMCTRTHKGGLRFWKASEEARLVKTFVHMHQVVSWNTESCCRWEELTWKVEWQALE